MSFKKIFFITVLLINQKIFAGGIPTSFDCQNDIYYQQPAAMKIPLKSDLRSYFGVNIGTTYSFLNTKIKKTNVSCSCEQEEENCVLQPMSTPQEEQSPNKNVNDYTIGAYGGIGTNYDNFYIGAELSGAYKSLDKNINVTLLSSNTKISVKQPMVIGLDMMLGYLTDLKDFLFYGRVGTATSLFKLKLNDGPYTDKIALGLRTGLGMEYFINESFSMRLEYLFSVYNSINKNYTSGATNYYYGISPLQTHQINLGLTFNF